MALPRIPYDSAVLARVVAELQRFTGARVQNAWQPDELTIILELYRGGGADREAYLLLSASPETPRMHLTASRGRNQDAPSPFLSAIRSNLVGKHIDSLKQVAGDRVAEIRSDDLTLTAEIMGKHSNLILSQNGRIVDAAKRIGASKSVRVILPGRTFAPAPTLGQGGDSPFLTRLKAAGPLKSGSFYVAGSGAYPFSLTALGYSELERESLNIALDQHYALDVPLRAAQQLKASLQGQLRRVREARQVALNDLVQAVDAGGMAARWQQMGELLLAYAWQLEAGQVRFETDDYEGNPILIKMDLEKTPIENANRYFEKAKKAKARLPLVQEQRERIQAELTEIEGVLQSLEETDRLREIEEIQERAKQRKWLNRPNLAQVEKEERPYAGHRIREALGPHGFTILYGENAVSNDYLTLRVAKPDDWWLHVRGAVSAHAIIQTSRKPERVPHETLLFAAKLVVANSVMKHASYVPVDLTLRKYVRKPRGAKAGTALYSHERTLYVD